MHLDNELLLTYGLQLNIENLGEESTPMKFVIATQELNYLINKIQNVVPLKPTMPILTNFLLEASNDELVLSATDLTVSVRCSIEVKVIEEGATTLPAKKLSQLSRELTAPRVELSSQSNDITTLIAGTSHFKINGMNKEGYPTWPNLSHTENFTIDQKILKDLLFRTSFAVSREENRYVLTGILMQINDGQMILTGTDGKRLARAHAPVKNGPPLNGQAIIPLKAIEEIIKNLRDEGEAKISLMEDKIAIQIDDTILLTKLLSGEYPDLSRVIPEHVPFMLPLHREELTSLLRQVSLFLADAQCSARFHFENGELKLTANTSSIGEGVVTMPVNTPSQIIEIAFNPGYLLDILRHCKEETVFLGLSDAHNPGVIIDGTHAGPLNAASPLFVIMPMHLSES